jgi:hypothetical protein
MGSMGSIKGSRDHSLAANEASKTNSKDQKKGKGKNPEARKEKFSKPTDESSSDHKGKKKKERSKCSYCQKGYHPEDSCMMKTIDEMAKMLQQNNLMVPANARNKDEEKPIEGKGKACNGHAVTSSPSTWILDSGASNHMAAKKESFSSIKECIGPSILMGDDTLVEVCGKGTVSLEGGYFDNVLHVPSLSMNLLSIYQITHSCSGRKVEFYPDSMVAFTMKRPLNCSYIISHKDNH